MSSLYNSHRVSQKSSQIEIVNCKKKKEKDKKEEEDS
jgi:hypothetical protein